MNYDMIIFLFSYNYSTRNDLNIIISRFFSHCAFFCQRLLPNLKLMLRPGVAVQEEAMGMMAMFFADANYTTKYYFPKEVKSSTIANGIIEGNLLTVKNNLIDIMTNKADISGEIKFK